MSNSKKGQYKNPLEALREIGWEATNSARTEASKFADSAVEQLLGKKNNFEGEIMPGQSVEMKDVIEGKESEENNAQQKLIVERELREQDRIFVERRTNELKIQINAIHEEIIKIAEVTPNLNREVEIAAFQAPIEPSTYELYFLERLFEFIKSFRKKIEDAYIWLEVANRRARKKNVWGQNLKKHGAKYLLSGEHYASRSSA